MKKVLPFLGHGLKALGWKGAVIVLAIAAVIVLVGYFGGAGWGDGDGDGNSSVATNQETSSSEENDVVDSEEENSENKEDEYDGAILAITVYENEYLYDNEEISLAGFIEIVKAVEGEFVVEVKDNNASLRAYNALLDKLEEMNVNVVEK